MRKRRSFAASSFPSFEEAEAALSALEGLARDRVVSLDDAAIVVKAPTGEVDLHQRRGLTAGGGVVGGGVIGVLAGLLLGIPVPGTLAGMAVGGIVGAIDTGIDDDRLKQIGRDLEPGGAALCILITDADWPALREKASGLGGRLVVVELSPEAEAALAEPGRRPDAQA
jgi:uncharacterized membrane protein